MKRSYLRFASRSWLCIGADGANQEVIADDSLNIVDSIQRTILRDPKFDFDLI